MLLDRTFDVSTTPASAMDVSEPTRRSLEHFLFEEARMLDERKLEDWLGLWTAEGMYWMPRVWNQANPFDHVSLFWEDKMLREVRVKRLENARNWSQQPHTRTARVMGNIMVDGTDAAGNVIVRSTFQLTEWRNGMRQLAGSIVHKLRREADAGQGESWRIVMKRVDLVNCEDVFGNLEVFI